MAENPNYYAVIPANVRYDKEITPNAKLLYGEITALCNKNGYCWASNNYFAELYGVTPQAISKWINILARKGYFSLEYESEGNECKERRIHLSTFIDRVSTNVDGGINKRLKGYQQKIKDNNTSINNTVNTTYSRNSDDFTDIDFDEMFPDNPKPEKAVSSTKQKKPLKDREPINDMEQIEKAYLEQWDKLYKAGAVYTPEPLKTGWIPARVLMKKLLPDIGVEKLKAVVIKAASDGFCLENGYALKTILASGVLNRLLNGNAQALHKMAMPVRTIGEASFGNKPPEILTEHDNLGF